MFTAVRANDSNTTKSGHLCSRWQIYSPALLEEEAVSEAAALMNVLASCTGLQVFFFLF